MIDALIVDEIRSRPGGLRAIAGPLVFGLETAARDAATLEAASGTNLVIFCELELRDEEIALVGFSDEERRRLYRELRKISGIGRRSALAVLDCGEATDVLRAVSGRDGAFFRGVPGLGAKRIESLITDLRRRYSSALPSALEVPVSWLIEVREAIAPEHGDAAEHIVLAVPWATSRRGPARTRTRTRGRRGRGGAGRGLGGG